MLITFEGGEGSGKTTQVELLRRWLADRSPVVHHEPGGTDFGERVRQLLLHAVDTPISPAAELYLFLAARAELVDEIVKPALEAGRIVILDRYHDSTLAYQGGARGLEVGWPEHFPRPDITFLLALPASEGLVRRQLAGGENRIDAEEIEFHERVAAAYDRLAAAEPARWVRLDATLTPEAIQAAIRERLSTLQEVSKSS